MKVVVIVVGVVALLLFVIALRDLALRAHIFHRMRVTALSMAAQSDAVGGVGITIISVSPTDIGQVVNLLGSRYPLSEVVVVLNERVHSNLLAQLKIRYALVSCAVDGCRVFRSRNRLFRRLVVVATAEDVDRDRLADIGAANGLYDYLLRVPSSCRLFDLSVGRIAEAVAAVGGVDRVTTSERGVELISRKRWRERGGFVAVGEGGDSSATLHIAEPLAYGAMVEKGHSMVVERSRYNFWDFLALNVMKSGNKLLSLVVRENR